MRSLFAYSLLVVQLLVVRFVTAQKYAIGSDRTNFWIINSDVSVGSDVRTARGAADHQPSDIALFLNINPSPEPTSLNNHTIYDDNTNLYIGIEEPISPGSRLKWVTDEYNWVIVATEEPDSYLIYSPGQVHFWFDNFSIPSVIEVDNIENANGADFLWRFKSSDSA